MGEKDGIGKRRGSGAMWEGLPQRFFVAFWQVVHGHGASRRRTSQASGKYLGAAVRAGRSEVDPPSAFTESARREFPHFLGPGLQPGSGVSAVACLSMLDGCVTARQLRSWALTRGFPRAADSPATGYRGYVRADGLMGPRG